MDSDSILYQELGRQGRRRDLTQAEIELSKAIEQAFIAGKHDFSAVAQYLSERGVLRPSGRGEPWSESVLLEELTLINKSLDEAYANAPAISRYA